MKATSATHFCTGGHELRLADDVADGYEQQHPQRRSRGGDNRDDCRVWAKEVRPRPADDVAGQASGQRHEPDGRALQEKVAYQPGNEPDEGTFVRAADEARAHGEKQHEVGGDIVNPQVVAETGLDKDAEQQDGAGLDGRPGQRSAGQPVCGDQSRTLTN